MLYLMLFIIFSLSLLPTIAQSSESLVGFVAADSPINVRERPGSNSAVIFTLPPNLSVSVLDESEDGAWIMIELADGRTGWVSASLMRVLESAIPSDLVPIEPDNATRLELITPFAATLSAAMTFSPDGRLLATMFWDGSIKVYDVRTKILIITLTAFPSVVTDIAFSPTGREMAASGTGTVKIWNTETWGERTRFQGHSDDVTSIAYSPNGEQLASAGRDDTLIIWDVRTGERLHVIDLNIRHVVDMEFSPDGTTLAAAGDWTNSVMRVWDTATGEELWSRSFGGNLHLDFSPDGNLVLLNDSHSLEMRGFNPEHGSPTFYINSSSINGGSSISINPSGSLLAAGTGNHAGFLLADIAQEEVVFFDDSASSIPHAGINLAFSPDGRVLAISDNTYGIELWGIHGE
jgi:WD40 repeat protein